MQTAEQMYATVEAATPAPISVTGVKPASAAQRYRNEQLMNLSPVEVIRKLYDIAIFGCKKNDTALAQKALTELISVLNFEQNDMALKLFQLYGYSKRCIRVAQIHEIGRITRSDDLVSNDPATLTPVDQEIISRFPTMG